MKVVTKASIMETISSLTRDDIEDRVKQASAHLNEIGLSHDLLTPPSGLENIQIDPLPFVLEQEEAQELQKGLSQWGKLLDTLYEDLYGPQNYLSNSGLEPRDLWENTSWDPAWHGSLPPASMPLAWFRLDLCFQEGQWRTQGLETGIPRGLGYSLENRIVHFRYFGSLIQQSNLTRLAPFFQNLKQLWMNSNPLIGDVPNIMFWTEGPCDPHYFEPAYLARYFGYPLVESRDLTVRSGKVFLKTLGGLERADVLIRWVGDKNIDPMAGNPPSLGGVPGLLGAIQKGTVILSNGPGSGLFGTPAFLTKANSLFSCKSRPFSFGG